MSALAVICIVWAAVVFCLGREFIRQQEVDWASVEGIATIIAMVLPLSLIAFGLPPTE